MRVKYAMSTVFFLACGTFLFAVFGDVFFFAYEGAGRRLISEKCRV